jgi:hypothetical protein
MLLFIKYIPSIGGFLLRVFEGRDQLGSTDENSAAEAIFAKKI